MMRNSFCKRLAIVCALALLVLSAVGCAPKPSPPSVEVTFNISEMTLDLFESGTLKATVAGSEQAPLWQSDDETVATVDGGTIRARGVGQTTIRAIVDGVTATAAVYVLDSGEIPSVRFNYTALALRAQSSITLEASAVYKNAPYPLSFTYSSTDQAVATVAESGKVTAIGVGEAYIVATATVNGVDVYGQVPVQVTA